MNSIGMDSRWVLYAAMGGIKVKEANFQKLILKRGNILVSTLRSRDDNYKTGVVKRFGEECLPEFEKGNLKPIVDRVMKLSEVGKAHEYVESNATVGKVILINDL